MLGFLKIQFMLQHKKKKKIKLLGINHGKNVQELCRERGENLLKNVK